MNSISIWTIISGILGILGFAISLINAIYFFFQRRVNVEITFERYVKRQYLNPNMRLIVKYMIANKSQLPISITDIILLIKGKKYRIMETVFEVQTFEHLKNGVVDNRVATYNDHLPINLAALGSQSGYIAFVIPIDSIEDFEKSLTFEIHTNRNTATQIELTPNVPVMLRR